VGLCGEMLAHPWCEAEAEAAGKILVRAKRKLGAGPVRRPTDKFRELRLSVEQSGEGVEYDAAVHLQGQWQHVYYVENSLMNTLFGLAFWEQIFADIPGAFHNAYQGIPRDMYEAEFVQRRAAGIQQRLAELRETGLEGELMKAYRRYSGYHCHWTDWRVVDEVLLARALQAIPRDHLLAIWERLLFDPAENRSGFPDLIAVGQQPGENSDHVHRFRLGATDFRVERCTRCRGYTPGGFRSEARGVFGVYHAALGRPWISGLGTRFAWRTPGRGALRRDERPAERPAGIQLLRPNAHVSRRLPR